MPSKKSSKKVPLAHAQGTTLQKTSPSHTLCSLEPSNLCLAFVPRQVDSRPRAGPHSVVFLCVLVIGLPLAPRGCGRRRRRRRWPRWCHHGWVDGRCRGRGQRGSAGNGCRKSCFAFACSGRHSPGGSAATGGGRPSGSGAAAAVAGARTACAGAFAGAIGWPEDCRRGPAEGSARTEHSGMQCENRDLELPRASIRPIARSSFSQQLRVGAGCQANAGTARGSLLEGGGGGGGGPFLSPPTLVFFL